MRSCRRLAATLALLAGAAFAGGPPADRASFYSELAAQSPKTALAVRIYEQGFLQTCGRRIELATLVERVSSSAPDPAYLAILKGIAEDRSSGLGTSIKAIRCDDDPRPEPTPVT